MRWLAPKPAFRWHFNNGPFVEVVEGSGPYKVQYIANKKIAHSAWLEHKQWVRASRQFYSEWRIEILDHRRKVIFAHNFDLRNKTVRINFDSKSLGDTLAWLPQAAHFADNHPTTKVYVSQFWPDLFDNEAYPQLVFIDPKEKIDDCYATYKIGYFFNDITNLHPIDPRLCTLGQVASDILGLQYKERKPYLRKSSPPGNLPAEKYVTIAMSSTAACKHWLYPDGWQLLVDWLITQDLKVMVIQQEESNLSNVIDESGKQSIENRIAQIQASELFIGLGSGLSWLAWASEKPVVLISGFSEAKAEFQSNCYRVINTRVCHGCWNDTTYTFDRGDWNWCPRHSKSDREHECSKSITPDMVINEVKSALANNAELSASF